MDAGAALPRSDAKDGILLLGQGSPTTVLADADLKKLLFEALDRIGDRRKVLVIPPDYTRFHSRAGLLTRCAVEYYADRVTDILPALGTHVPMTDGELEGMFPGIPRHLFRIHDWRKDLATLGEVPLSYVEGVTGGAVRYPWPAQVNRLLVEGGFDLILSIGQVVPHEVIGMANYTKNIFVGTGGREGINKSHFIGAAFGMERIMGRADTPVRRVIDYAADHFAAELPIVYAHTVIGKDESGRLAVRGLFVGTGRSCFLPAAELSLKVNFTMVPEPLKKVVVYLDPAEFKSTWLGNKSIYRTRMAIADAGELIVLAPGVREFGEDKGIDSLIRKHGYVGTERVLELIGSAPELQESLGAAAHLIHGSSEGRFSTTYCPGHLSRAEVESVNFEFGDLSQMLRKYDPAKLRDGVNVLAGGEEIFYVSNPALGLWAHEGRFRD